MGMTIHEFCFRNSQQGVCEDKYVGSYAGPGPHAQYCPKCKRPVLQGSLIMGAKGGVRTHVPVTSKRQI